MATPRVRVTFETRVLRVLRDPTEAELALEPTLVLESMVSGEMRTTRTGRALAAAELGRRLVVRLDPDPAAAL